jgi:glycopeptide antibiotics resistance protein
MSLSVELTQYYDQGRVTAFSDSYTNTLGTLLGGLAALAIGAKFRLPFIGEVTTRPIPTLLIIAWLAYRMYPYVPTIDLHKYWNALKPIVLTPSLTPYDLFR